MVIQTALIGSLASIGIDDKVQAIVTIVILSSVVTPPQLLSFVMISLGISDQVDMCVFANYPCCFDVLHCIF